MLICHPRSTTRHPRPCIAWILTSPYTSPPISSDTGTKNHRRYHACSAVIITSRTLIFQGRLVVGLLVHKGNVGVSLCTVPNEICMYSPTLVLTFSPLTLNGRFPDWGWGNPTIEPSRLESLLGGPQKIPLILGNPHPSPYILLYNPYKTPLTVPLILGKP